MAQPNQSIEATLGHTFQNQHLCNEALTTAGATYHPSASAFDGNAALALIGDAILRIGVGVKSRDLHESKGQASSRMKDVAGNENLAAIFDMAHLSPHVIGNPAQKGMMSTKIKATVVEALLGAVYEDAGLDAALAVMRHLQIG